MFSSSNEPGGTSYRHRLEIQNILCWKTGSSQIKRFTEEQREAEVKQESLPYKDRDHALFVAFAPYKNPQYAISVLVEHGGLVAAAPIAKKVLKKVLDRHELRRNINNKIGRQFNATTKIHSIFIRLRDVPSLDYVLVFAILILGITSMFAMYSTDGGEFKYHTNSHILRFFVFFGMFFIISFISIRFWHETSYLIYIGIFILLLGVKYFGLTSSGSKRWLDLYFMNLQPPN